MRAPATLGQIVLEGNDAVEKLSRKDQLCAQQL